MSIIEGTPKHNRRGSSKGLEEGSENSKSLVRENGEKEQNKRVKEKDVDTTEELPPSFVMA